MGEWGPCKTETEATDSVNGMHIHIKPWKRIVRFPWRNRICLDVNFKNTSDVLPNKTPTLTISGLGIIPMLSLYNYFLQISLNNCVGIIYASSDLAFSHKTYWRRVLKVFGPSWTFRRWFRNQKQEMVEHLFTYISLAHFGCALICRWKLP